MASRPLPAVIDEARQLAVQGTREVVVTGVCVGAYEDGPHKLADLLAAVAQVEGIERVRLSSIQPIETCEALIETLAAHLTLCPHLHLSLQSGDDTVLKAMQRPYDTAFYRDLVARLRRRIPGIAITTDIIVGFPGETGALFENTLRFSEEIAFSRTHVFRYSPRQRTYAHEHYADNVAPDEKERRHKALTAVCAQSQAEFAGAHVGQVVPVLVEGRGMREGWVSGYTPTYVRTHFPGTRADIGRILPVCIAGATEDGEALGEAFAGSPPC
jgi:threonylcarbamoyladenosine tRNA methylthiotransferase MtaB